MTPAATPDVERRAALELRAASGRKIEGYAAVFNAPAALPGFSERVLPGAFTASLAAGADLLALLDHDPTRLLARTANNTLRLSEDSRGLAFDLDLPNTTLGNDTLEQVRAGLLGGVSMGFRVAKGGDTWSTPTTRELRAVSLIEISLIQAFPAYSATSVAISARFRCASVDPQRVRRALILAS